MCLSPKPLKNPNKFTRFNRYWYLKDSSSYQLSIPCGHCAQCIAMKQMSLVERVQMMSLASYMYFGLFTYSSDALPRYRVNEYSIPYADVSDMQSMIKRVYNCGKLDRRFSYFYVSELGGEHARPHFHLLLALEKRPEDTFLTPYQYESLLHDLFLKYWSRNLGSRGKPFYQPNCIPVEYYVNGMRKGTYGFHYVEPQLSQHGEADVAWYCLKYMLKPSDKEARRQQALHLNLSEDEYNEVWDTIRSRYDSSPSFGLSVYPGSWSLPIYKHIRSSINRSLQSGSPYPLYFNPTDGSSWPLGRYYFNKLVTLEDAERFYYNNDHEGVSIDSFHQPKDVTPSQILVALNRYRQVLDQHSLPSYDVYEDV